MMSGAGQQTDAIDPPPSPLERALAERGCSTPAMLAAEPDVRQRCADTQLALLRDDFGVNLKRLSNAERKRVDAACRRLETTHGRDGYLDCVNMQLVALRVQRGSVNGGRVPALDAAADHGGGSTPTSATTANGPTPPPTPAQPTSAARTATIAGVALLAIAAAAGSLAVIKKRRPRLVCRECGDPTTQLGDLCPACRHAAADALRRAAADRMEQIRADEAERRRTLQAEEEERRQQALREDDAGARALEEAQCREENARRAREEEARREIRRQAAVEQQRSAEDVFDPYAVLGVRRDITSEDLRAAYEQARSKYDEGSVSHLSDEVQQHYREKALAVDRAYQMLAG
jgi:hypothetical protein